MRRVTTSALLLALTACDGKPIGNAKVVPTEPSASSGPVIPDDPEMRAQEKGPKIGAIQFAVTVYERPDHRSKKVGYLRVGTQLSRGKKPVAFDSCQGGFYNVLPKGYVCLDDGATIDVGHALLRAGLKQADHKRPLPYAYAFVRANAPRYFRLPTEKEQFEFEFELEKHLRSFRAMKENWNSIEVGSNDVEIDERGIVLQPAPLEAPALTEGEKYGGDGRDRIPWAFENGRQIPNVSSYKVPKYAVITNRLKRHSGVALVDAFMGEKRHFALTTDLRLVPTSKLKPARGSTFHGVELTEGWELPVGFVKRPEAIEFEKHKKRYKRGKKRYAYGTPVQLTGEVRNDGERRFVTTEDGTYLRTRDLAIVVKPSELPNIARKNTKWIDISIQRQVLVLYEGKKPIFATMVSTGKDGIGDPETTHSTPRGIFRIRDKHVTATMSSQQLGEEFELTDVPWTQYFQHGYALHAAYWHSEFGRPRSHGCVNLSPLDAYRIFQWTTPELPGNWHGVEAGETMGSGTLLHIAP